MVMLGCMGASHRRRPRTTTLLPADPYSRVAGTPCEAPRTIVRLCAAGPAWPCRRSHRRCAADPARSCHRATRPTRPRRLTATPLAPYECAATYRLGVTWTTATSHTRSAVSFVHRTRRKPKCPRPILTRLSRPDANWIGPAHNEKKMVGPKSRKKGKGG